MAVARAEMDSRVPRLRVPRAAVGSQHVVPGGLARPVLDLGLVRRVVVREQELLGDPPVTIMALVDEEPEPNNKGYLYLLFYFIIKGVRVPK